MKRVIAVFLSALLIGMSMPCESTASSTVVNDAPFIAVTGGDWHSLGLRKDGTVAAAGNNNYGQCNVGSWSGIVGLTASKSLSIGLKSDGTAVVAGVDEHGQGEISSWTDLVQIETGIDHTVGLKSDGTVVCVGDNEYGQCDTSGWKDIIAIAAGGWHTVGLMKDGGVVACGNNSYMQCGTAKWSGIAAIAAGEYHTAAMKRDGTAVAIGYNADGRCDVRDWKDLSAIAAGGYHTIGLKQDGTVVALGNSSDSRCDLETWKGIRAIGAGRYHSLGVTRDGHVLAMGFNNDDQCDVEDWARASGPVHTPVTEKADSSPSSGEPETILPESKPADLTFNEAHEWESANSQPIISAGANQTVGIEADGTVVAAGLNNYGQCNVGDWSDIVAVDTELNHTVGLRQDGTAVAVGYNIQKQCDVGNWRDIISIEAGWSFSVGLKKDGTVLATGPSYQNGCDVEDWSDIIAISACKERTMGLRKDGTVVITGFLHEKEAAEIPGWTDIISVATGHFHSVGIKSDGTAVAAGINSDGQCEVSSWIDIIAVAANENHTIGLRKDGTVVAAGRNDHGQCDVQDWSGIIAVSTGQMHTVGLREDGSVVATGNNGSGQCQVENWQLMSRLQPGDSSAIVIESDHTATEMPQEASQVTSSQVEPEEYHSPELDELRRKLETQVDKYLDAKKEDTASNDQPPAADDLPPEPTPGPTVTVEITVRFPHAERTGTYTGEMKDGVAHGKGTFTSTNAEGISWTYEGAWENGAMNGYGTLTWPSDSLEFRGQYRDNQPYDGEWLIDGASVYTGGFRMCPDCGVTTFHGTGRLTNRLGRVIYEGPFADGLLSETAQARQARAQALDPTCGTLSSEGYAAMMNTPGSGTGTLLRLDGRIREVFRDEEHGWGEFILLNNGDAACPVLVSYRYGDGEERAQAGWSATIWGTVTGLGRVSDNRGREQTVLQIDADVIRLNADQAQRGLNEVVITAVKALDGRALKNREFTFALDETFTVIEERVNPLDGTITFVPVTYTARQQTKANSRDGTVAFNPVRYTSDDIGGVFTYTVTEIPGLEAGMAYDPMVMTVTVIITDNGNGRPAATVFYPADILFNNSVAAPSVQVPFEVTKQLQGRDLQDGEFTFQLRQGDQILDEIQNDSEGVIWFCPLEFFSEDIGRTIEYSVVEVPGTEPGMIYDPTVMSGTLRVEDAGNGTPTVMVLDYPDDTTFYNVFQPEPVAVPQVFEAKVDLKGRPLKEGEFTFQLLEAGEILQVASNYGDGKVIFDAIDFTAADIGTKRRFTIRQVPGDLPGMTYDDMEIQYNVTAEFDPDGIGALMLIPLIPEDTAFNNVYEAKAEAQILPFDVMLEGRAIKNGEFNFELLENGKVLVKKRNDSDGKIALGRVVLSQEDIGLTTTYTVRQVSGDEPAMIYDQTEKRIICTAIMNDNGELEPVLSYPDGLTFHNSYLSISQVAMNKTSTGPGNRIQVTWEAKATGGNLPYSYHFLAYKDGKEYEDLGWVKKSSYTLDIDIPGDWQMKVTVEDEDGQRSEAVMSPIVTVNQPPWSPKDLNGVWKVTHVITKISGTGKTPTKVGDVSSYEWTIQMKDDKNGTFTSDFGLFTGSTGTISYSNKTIKAEIQFKDQKDTYEGTMNVKDGIVTFEGNRTGKRLNTDLTFTATWTMEKVE